MKNAIWLLISLAWAMPSKAQSGNLFNDNIVANIYLTLSPDTLMDIYANPTSTVYRSAQFVFDDGVNLPDTLPQVGFRLRGNTSRWAAKKSFKVSFNEFVTGQTYQGAKKINLNGSHNDPTMLREKVFYDLWQQTGLPQRRTSFVKVYINGSYYGLYTKLEEINKDWLQSAYAENNGNLYKCTYPADLAYINSNQQSYKNIQNSTATGGRAYELQTNQATDDYTDLVQLITTLNQTPNASFVTQIEQQLNVEGYLKALALDVATGNWDSYAYNKNNYFLYHNLNTGKFEFITYDTDNTLGIDWLNIDWATRNYQTWIHPTEPRPLAAKLLAIPAYKQRYTTLLDSITRYITHLDILSPRLNALQTLIAPAATTDPFADLDWGFTPTDFYDGMTQTVIGHAPYGIKPFLATRAQNSFLQGVGIAIVDDNWAITAFPNPIKQTLTLLRTPTNQPFDATVELCNIMGQSISKQQWVSTQTTLSVAVEQLPAGVYVLLIEQNNGTKTSFKVVK